MVLEKLGKKKHEIYTTMKAKDCSQKDNCTSESSYSSLKLQPLATTVSNYSLMATAELLSQITHGNFTTFS